MGSFKILLSEKRYRVKEYLKTFLPNPPDFEQTGKYLVAIPCGTNGKKYLESIVHHFGNDHFDYIIFSYDHTPFDEDIFQKCRVIDEEGVVWYFAKKYLSPAACAGYDYIFFWDDDIDIMDFDVENFLEIMQKNELSVAQPALMYGQNASHAITAHHPSYTKGRFTDFVEIMVPVFRRDAWGKWWDMLEWDTNFWGWGYDLIFKSLKNISKMGIIDAQTVLHTRSVSSSFNPRVREEADRFFLKHKKCTIARRINLRGLK